MLQEYPKRFIKLVSSYGVRLRFFAGCMPTFRTLYSLSCVVTSRCVSVALGHIYSLFLKSYQMIFSTRSPLDLTSFADILERRIRIILFELVLICFVYLW